MKTSFLSVLAIAGCAHPVTPPSDGAKIHKLEALGVVMKNDINPAFSKLTFLLAHADTLNEDANTVRGEIEIAGTNLRTAIGKLRLWHDPPTESDQGREVFLTYAASIDGLTTRLIDALGRDDRRAALDQLEQIADTCNNCHHFFRLDIEDSVVMRTTDRNRDHL